MGLTEMPQDNETWINAVLHVSVSLAFCFSRVEEIKWTSWAKEVGVLKEEPGNTNDLEINPEGKVK